MKKTFKLVQNTLNIGYLRGRAVTRCLAVVYKGVVSEVMEIFRNHKSSINRHLRGTKYSTCGIPKNSLYYK